MSEDDFSLITVALNEGFIGNKSVLNTIGFLTTGVFNYIRSSNAPAYTLKTILGGVYDYLYPPLSDEDQKQKANQQLISYMMAAPGAKEKLNVGEV